MRPYVMATQVTFVGGERIGVVQALDEVLQAISGASAGSSGVQLVELAREDGTPVHINPAHILFVRTVQ